MPKRCLALVAVATLVGTLSLALVTSSDAAGGKGIKVLVAGKPLVFDTQPQLLNGRVMLPLRGVLEALGSAVVWDAGSQTVTLSRENVQVKLTVGSRTAYCNGQAVNMGVAPLLVNGRVLVPFRFIAEAFGEPVHWDASTRTVYLRDRGESLPVVGTYENLKALLAEADENRAYGLGGRVAIERASSTQAMEDKAVGAAAPTGPVDTDYSTTNLQVEGVDEADIVKTDGQYIYQVNQQRIVIARAYPAEQMQIVSTLRFEGLDFSPQELYVDGNKMVVIGGSAGDYPVCRPQAAADTMIYPPPYRRVNTVKAVVYDISDRRNIKKVREVELEGNYVSSRKIGSALYLVANRGIWYHIMENGSENPTPSYRDSAQGGNPVAIGYDRIRYFPGCPEPSYLLIGGLDLNNSGKAMQVSTYLGAGQQVYCSAQNLYVAATVYPTVTPASGRANGLIFPAPASPNTVFYRFALNQGRIDYSGKGEVPGTILNQFSMDESNGYFRVATTQGEVWRQDQYTSKNNVYVLDGSMKIVGRIEEIAPGETIYSARFMGDRAYLVTFRTVDPLFVLDLSNPVSPQILGALKIPGYSDYLHPYDETHLIGFGKDTIEVSQKDGSGRDTGGTMAYYQGMKMAMFDVSDVKNPVQMFAETIGDRGTDSELLRNHKALLFSREKNLLAFPVTVMQVKDKGVGPSGFPSYGEFTFQGAYVYNVDLSSGFKLKGRITHLTGQDMLKAGSHWYSNDRAVERIVYIGNVLYTLSRGMIKANGMADLKEIAELPIQ